jgi:hypothetical protein
MTTPNMGMTEPTDHASTDVWGLALNAALDVIDAHDHTTGKGVLVPSAALKINANVSWSFGGTNYAITDAQAIDFTPVAAASIASLSSALFANASDSNNLYYRNSAGTNVQVTSGNTLNISIVGGIGGDYASVGALFSFDDSTKRYLAQSEGSPRPWSGLATADIDLYEKAVSITNKVTLKSPAALAGSYTLTFPAANPGSTQLWQVSSAGVFTASNTVANQVTLGVDYNFTGFTRTVAVPLGTATRLTNCGFTAISGTSTGLDGAAAWLGSSGAWEFTSQALNGLGLHVGDRIKSIRIVHKTIAGTHGYDLYKIVAAGGGSGAVTDVSNASGSSSNDHTATVGSPVAIAAGEQWFLDLSGTTTGDLISHVEITYDHP